MLPSESIGTPRITLPSATPSSRAMPREDPKKNQSHIERQRALSRLDRNSMATVRRISTSSTSIIAR